MKKDKYESIKDALSEAGVKCDITDFDSLNGNCIELELGDNYGEKYSKAYEAVKDAGVDPKDIIFTRYTYQPQTIRRHTIGKGYK